MPADDAADPSPRSARSHISGELRRDRQAVRAAPAEAPAPAVARSARPAPPAQKRMSKKGQFHRPELTTPWQKFTGNLAVRIVFWSLLVVVTGAVVVLAVQRFAA